MVATSFLRVALAVNLVLAVSGLVIPRAPQGTQFITGACTSDADCASGCCTHDTGKCGARAVAEGPGGGGGCGFGGGAAAAPAAAAPAAAAVSAPPPNVGGPPFDPAGVPNVGNGAGKQFIGGQCLSAADCNSGCCAGPSGICSGVGAQTQAGKTGCGFVAGATASAPPPAAAPPPPAAAPAPVAAAAAPVGTQFITGACASDADCASGCCTKNTGKCGARAVAEGPGGGGGCGFGSAAAAPAPAAAAPAPVSAAAPPPNVGGPPFDPAGVPNVGNGAGKQFIGGQCLSAADCNSGCCAGPSGICSGVGAQTQAGKTGCGFVAGSAAAAPPPAAAAPPPPPPAAAPAVAPGTQFITGACSSDGDCASGCCTKNTGKCGARAVAEGPGGGGGCGFGA